jgi:hypothetical protein
MRRQPGRAPVAGKLFRFDINHGYSYSIPSTNLAADARRQTQIKADSYPRLSAFICSHKVFFSNFITLQ